MFRTICTDELIYRNSPLDFLANMGSHCLLTEQDKGKTLILCCGQGNYERITGVSSGRLKGILDNLKVDS